MIKYLILFSLLCTQLSAQVDSKPIENLYETTNVSGSVEVGHVWGRTCIMPVTSVWVKIVDGNIHVGAKTDQPVLDGEVREDYRMSAMRGKLSEKFPTYVQTIKRVGSVGIWMEGEDGYNSCEIVMVSLENGLPKSVIYHRMDYANFDVQQYIEDNKNGSVLRRRSVETLEDFEGNFRTYTFRAEFDHER